MPTDKKRKRNVRATVICQRVGLVLLVRDRGKKAFSLPGGRIEGGEGVLEAAVRELREELGLQAVSAMRCPEKDFVARYSHHHVVHASFMGEPVLQDGELVEYRWWDGLEELAVMNHVTGILALNGCEQFCFERRDGFG